eukprot:s470_g11.t1
MSFWGDADDDEEDLRFPASDSEPCNDTESLWFPASEAEPQVPGVELRRLDGVADRVEAEPRAIKLMAEPDAEMSFDAEGWIIDRCLPGQRDGARRWYDHFLDKLKEEFGATAEQALQVFSELCSKDREALVLSLPVTAQADPMEHEEFHDDSSNALSSTSWTRWTSWWSTIVVAVLAILVGWYYTKMSTRSGDRENHGDHEGDQQHDGDPAVQDEVDDGDARDRSKSRSRSRSRTRSDSRDQSFGEGEEEQCETDEEDIEFPRTKNHTAIAGLAVHLLNKVRLGFPEHVCLYELCGISCCCP